MLWTDQPGNMPLEITKPQYVGFFVRREGFFWTTSNIFIISLIENLVREKFIVFYVDVTVCLRYGAQESNL